MIVPGPGGVKIQCSPGTVVYQGYPTVSGHMMIPCTEFDKCKGSTNPTVLLTGVSDKHENVDKSSPSSTPVIRAGTEERVSVSQRIALIEKDKASQAAARRAS